MQRQIFPKIDNSIYFGKYDNDLMLNDSFHELHYKIFTPLYSLKRYRSRNSEILLDKYASFISDRIIDQSQKCKNDVDSAILSNETILDYGMYNAELNLLLLKRVTNKIKKNLSAYFNVEIQILVTFREQCSLLQSFYAYNYPNLRDKHSSLDSFIENGLANHHDEIFGSLWFDEIFDLVHLVFDNDKVLFVPYEILRQDQNEFIKSTVGKLGLIKQGDLTYSSTAKKENINKGRSGGNNLRSAGLFSKVLDMATYCKFLVPKSYVEQIKQMVITIQSKQNVTIGAEVKITEKHSQQVRKLYRKSNARMAKLTSTNLESLGYSVLESGEK